MNTNLAWNQFCTFFASFPESTISKVFKSFGFDFPVYYIKERGGMIVIKAIEICQQNKLKPTEFMNLFLLQKENLNLN